MFITEKGMFCLKVMPFGLKNASATYQRMASKIFVALIREILWAYINDTMVKGKDFEDHTKSLKIVFE